MHGADAGVFNRYGRTRRLHVRILEPVGEIVDPVADQVGGAQALQPGRRRLRQQQVLDDPHQRVSMVATGGERPGPRSEEHTSALQSLMRISSADSCLKKKDYIKSTFRSPDHTPA